MTTFPNEFLTLIISYAGLFSKRVFAHVKLLLAGAILAPGKRTVCGVLRIVGFSREQNFHKYHRVLSLAHWSGLQAGRILLLQLLDCFLPAGPVVVGIDETLERRWGSKIKKRGIYRDAVRSSGTHFAKSSGLRWISMMLLLPIGWAARVWALPFLSVLAPSERYSQQQGKAHKTITGWARQLLLQLKRWLPERQIIAVGDSTYAAIELLNALRQQLTIITRLRMDAALFEPVAERRPGQSGRNRKKGERLPGLKQVLNDAATSWQQIKLSHWYGRKEKEMQITSATALWYHKGKPVVPLRWVLLRDPEGKLDPVALLSTDLELSAQQIVSYFVRRWAVEVTWEEGRAHLGLETQRQWSDKAIDRTTPVLLGLFSIITLLADRLQQQGKLPIATTAWYKKQKPTFSDAIAAVRKLFWKQINFATSDKKQEMAKIPKPLLKHLRQVLAYAT
jgi:hypothetical protein